MTETQLRLVQGNIYEAHCLCESKVLNLIKDAYKNVLNSHKFGFVKPVDTVEEKTGSEQKQTLN